MSQDAACGLSVSIAWNFGSGIHAGMESDHALAAREEAWEMVQTIWGIPSFVLLKDTNVLKDSGLLLDEETGLGVQHIWLRQEKSLFSVRLADNMNRMKAFMFCVRSRADAVKSLRLQNGEDSSGHGFMQILSRDFRWILFLKKMRSHVLHDGGLARFVVVFSSTCCTFTNAR